MGFGQVDHGTRGVGRAGQGWEGRRREEAALVSRSVLAAHDTAAAATHEVSEGPCVFSS